MEGITQAFAWEPQPSHDDRNSTKPNVPKQKPLNPEAPSYNNTESTTTCCTSTSNVILLQTVKTFVFNLNDPSY